MEVPGVRQPSSARAGHAANGATLISLSGRGLQRPAIKLSATRLQPSLVFVAGRKHCLDRSIHIAVRAKPNEDNAFIGSIGTTPSRVHHKKLYGVESFFARFALAFTCTFAIVHLIYLCGGLAAPGLIWLCAIPIVLAVLLGVSWAVWGNVFVLGVLGAFLVFHLYGFGPNILAGANYLIEKMLNFTLFVLFSGFLTISILWGERNSVVKLEKEHDDAGAKEGAWASRAPHLTAAMLFSAFHGAVDDDIVAPARMSRKRLTAGVRAFCRMALGLAARQ